MITFIARLATPEGQIVHGEFEAHPSQAKLAAEKTFPKFHIVAVYPKETHHRQAWMF